MTLENSEPVPAQQLFEGFFKIEQECTHGLYTGGGGFRIDATLITTYEIEMSVV
jgi:hypothetical protein